MILGIKPHGIAICDVDRNELAYIAYTQVASWGVNTNIFVLVVQKTEFDIKKYYFESDHVRNPNLD